MYKGLLAAVTAVTAVALSVGVATAQTADKEIRWGTSSVGSTGHKSLVNLAGLLNKEWQGYQISVQPTPGAVISVKGYATEQFEGYYGSDVAFYELANDIRRFKGFKPNMKRQPVQSLWTFTVEVGLAIHDRDKDKYEGWGSLAGETLFTGPRPWDTRAQMERGLETLGVDFKYIEVDISAAGALLDQGNFAAFTVYSNAEAATAPWITQTGLATDWNALNPTAAERARLSEAGFAMVEVDGSVFSEDIGAETITLLPFYYGYHVGMEVPDDAVYQMLMLIEKNLQTLVETDKGFTQLAANMPLMQRRGVEAAAALVEIHPGLARYMRERDVWDAAWDSRVARR